MACEEIVCKTIDIKSDKAVESLKAVDKTSKDVTKSSKGLEGQMDAMPGPLKRAGQAVKGLNKAFKALLANPIVALIAAIVLAFVAMGKAFTKTQEGADKMKDAMAQVSAAIDVVIGRAAALFKALGQIIRGNFKEGWVEIKEAVSDVGDEITEATKAAKAFTQAQRDLTVSVAEGNKENAVRRKEIAELVLVTRDLTVGIEDRRKAIIKADKIEQQINAENLRQQKERIRLAEQDIANDPVNFQNREKLLKLREEETKLIELETQSIGRQRELKNRLNELDNQARAAEAERQAEIDAEHAHNMKLDEEKADWEIEQAKKAADEKKKIDDLAAKNKAANAQNEADAVARSLKQQEQNEKNLQAVKGQIYQDSLGALLGFLGEGSKVAKAIMIADATKSAIQSAIAAYSSAAAIPVVGFVLGPIAAAAALALGMANVKKIAQTPDPLGGGPAAVPSVELATPTAISPDLSDPGLAAPTDVNIIQDQTVQGAPKAYVVASEVTAQQEVDQKREADVTL